MIVKIIISLAVVILIGIDIFLAIRDGYSIGCMIADLIQGIGYAIEISITTSRMKRDARKKYIRGDIDLNEFVAIMNRTKARSDEIWKWI